MCYSERKRDTPSKINLWLTTLDLSFTNQIKIGNRHDYDIYKRNHPVTPKQVVNVFDLGYLGVEKVFPEQMSSLPNKKKRNQELSVEQEEYNLGQANKRIIIGHTICRVKKYRKKHNLLFVSDLKCCYLLFLP